jgi:hypothetical protein
VVCPFAFSLPTVYLRRFPRVSLAQTWQKRAVFERETQDGHTGLGPIFFALWMRREALDETSPAIPGFPNRSDRHAPHAADLWAEVPTGERPPRSMTRTGAASVRAPAGVGAAIRRAEKNSLRSIDRVSGICGGPEASTGAPQAGHRPAAE